MILQAANLQLSVLEDILVELRALNAKMGTAGEGRSSVEIEKHSKGENFKVKVYDQSPILPAEQQAVESFNRMSRRFGGRVANEIGQDE